MATTYTTNYTLGKPGINDAGWGVELNGTIDDIDTAIHDREDALTAHAAAADPHVGYQKETEKDAASGYCGLDASVRIATARLGSGTADASSYLRGDSTWQTFPTKSAVHGFMIGPNGVTWYAGPTGGGASTLELQKTPAPFTGVFRNFRVWLSAAGNMTVTVRVAGGDSLMTVTIAGGQTGSYTASDIAVTAGDYINVKAANGDSYSGNITWSWEYAGA